LNARSPAIDSRAARRRFERAASTYPKFSRLEGEVAARMLARLDYIRLDPGRLLDAGSGPPRPDLRKRYPRAMAIALDFSCAMLRARGFWTRLTGRGVHPVCADLEKMPLADAAVDLAWSNMALHWLSDPLGAFREFRRVLAPNGLLMFSTLGPDSLKELRAAAGAARVHAFIDMHDLGDMLVQAGFADPVMDQEMLTLTWASPAALLAELRSLGGNADPARWAGLRTPRWRERLHAALRERAGTDGRIALSFELVYGHAFNPPPRVAGETRVGVDELRAMARGKRPRGRETVG
jgi:malonyl-CoA O-methyltransferase